MRDDLSDLAIGAAVAPAPYIIVKDTDWGIPINLSKTVGAHSFLAEGV